MQKVTLYTKPDCHLCEAVEQMIERLRASKPFDLTIRNILDDKADFDKFEHAIPVVILNGVEIARYRLSETEFLNSLAENC